MWWETLYCKVRPKSKNVLISCVFALLERKTEIMYIRVREKAREDIEITCQTDMCDFEKASTNSFIF
ncbi:hypothetical protein HZS_1553 [Henneguya salminicola]|nr:hypothetical protein HZS_1553 [Henneguya salminicola]